MKTHIYFTSDWHLGSANVMRFDNRPFVDIEEMDAGLIKNYNSVVPPHGVCYFLGDMGELKNLKKVVPFLNGYKILILGNHDKGSDRYKLAGFDLILTGAKISVSGQEVTLSHCPLRGVFREDTSTMKSAVKKENWHGEGKFEKYSFPDFGQFHLHGHIHSPNKGRSTRILGRQFDVGLPANNYKPVSHSEITSWIDLTLKKEIT